MIKILYLIDKLAPAGTQINLLEIVKRLDRTRFEPKVIALVSGGSLLEEYKAAGVEPIVLNVKRAYGISGFKALFFLIKLMKNEQISIVQNHFLHADILGTIAARLAGVRTIITTRRDEGFWRGKRQMAINRLLNQFVTIVLANSEAVKKAVQMNEHVGSKRIKIIYNGVDLKKYDAFHAKRQETRRTLGIADDKIVVGMIATMKHRVKGHRFFIRAAQMAAHEFPQAKFLLVGDGPLRSALENYSNHIGVKKQIMFTGSRRDIPDLLNAMDIVCAPSLSEGFSNTILEAMSIGKPVVATNVGGNSELVLNEETGFLVRPRDAKAIATKLLVLLQNKKLCSEMGKAGRQRVTNEFQMDHMMKRYETFYQDLAVKALRPIQYPIKIMFLIWSLDLGGAEQVVMNLAKGLDRKLFEPVVCCLNEKGRYADQIEPLGIKVIALQKKPGLDPFIIFKLIYTFKQENIRLIHTHLFTSNFWGRIAAALVRIPVVSTEHNLDTWKNRFHFWADRWLAKTNKRMIFVSESVRDFYHQKLISLNGKAKVLYNGIDLAKFKNKEFKRHVEIIGIVGRLVPQKLHQDFIDAIEILKGKGKHVTGLIVGDGPLRKKLEEQVLKKKLTDHIKFSGFVTHMDEVYQMMDLFVLCSSREGFPMTILEAMASGVPVISTNVGGVSECIQEGENGLLVPSGKPNLLAEAILKIIENKELRKKIVLNARKQIEEHFNLDKMIGEHQVLYQEVLS